MRQYDPKYHTAEHIITGLIKNLYGGRIVDNRFKGNKARCDYRVALGDLSLDDFIKDIQEKMLTMIADDLPVTFSTVERDEKCQMLRPDPSLDSLDDVPPDAATIRLVHIGDGIITPCSGAHVAHTAEIGSVRINTWKHVSDGVVRLTFKVV